MKFDLHSSFSWQPNESFIVLSWLIGTLILVVILKIIMIVTSLNSFRLKNTKLLTNEQNKCWRRYALFFFLLFLISRTTFLAFINSILKCGTTRMEVDLDGSLSYPKPQVSTADNCRYILLYNSISLYFIYCFVYLNDICS